MLTPKITNKTLTLADTEYSIALSESCQHFSFQLRTAAVVRYAFETGKVATPTAPYAELKSGGVYTSPQHLQLKLGGQTIYFANAAGSVVVELVEWY